MKTIDLHQYRLFNKKKTNAWCMIMRDSVCKYFKIIFLSLYSGCCRIATIVDFYIMCIILFKCINVYEWRRHNFIHLCALILLDYWKYYCICSCSVSFSAKAMISSVVLFSLVVFLDSGIDCQYCVSSL